MHEEDGAMSDAEEVEAAISDEYEVIQSHEVTEAQAYYEEHQPIDNEEAEEEQPEIDMVEGAEGNSQNAEVVDQDSEDNSQNAEGEEV